ncbi:MAG: response regulator [Acidobacteriia bacterium]|nr:response regulator [Terriglobia bacterium]
MNPDQVVVGVVDDDPRVVESLQELLLSAGYEVLPFLSAESFLEANGFQQVDCVISDIGLPVMSGSDLLEIARAQHPAMPVILITARDEQPLREMMTERGARRLFRKPFDGSELLTALASILRETNS